MDSSYSVKVGDYISSTSSSYKVEKILGSGGYGVVTLCRNYSSGQMVALKVLQQNHFTSSVGQKEAQMLRRLKECGSESYNIVKWIDSFRFRGNFCHEFERLDISLLDFLNEAPFESLPLKQIRPILTQIIHAMLFLKSIGVIHCDLKPENVMMIDHVRQPLKIKLIDFGQACSVSDVKPGKMLQTIYYRAPEMVVGSAFSESLDMWSVGCVIVEMFLGKTLFWVENNEELIRMIVQTLGQPPKHVLDFGRHTRRYFRLPKGSPDWIHVVNRNVQQISCAVPSLDAIYKMDPYRKVKQSCGAEDFDRAVFVDLVKRMLDLDPQTRISSEEVLNHPFLNLTHMAQNYCEYCLESVKLQLQVLGLYQAEQPSTSPTTELESASAKRDEEVIIIPQTLSSDLDLYWEKQPSASPTSSSSSQTPTSGLKRKREEQESPRKRTKRDASVLVASSVQRSGDVCEKSPDVNLLDSSSPNVQREGEKTTELESASAKRDEEVIIIPQTLSSDLDLYWEKQPSASPTSSSSSQTPTSGLKRKREEQESPRKRTKRDASVLVASSVQRSGDVCEKFPDVFLLYLFRPNVQREGEKTTELESPTSSSSSQTPTSGLKRKREEQESQRKRTKRDA